jgi:hypothetical protein
MARCGPARDGLSPDLSGCSQSGSVMAATKVRLCPSQLLPASSVGAAALLDSLAGTVLPSRALLLVLTGVRLASPC